MSGWIGAGNPYRWTGMIAFVFDVTAARAFLTSRQYVAGSASTSTGFAPTIITVLAVAMNVIAGTITSSPGPMFRPRRISSSALVPLSNVMQWDVPLYAAH